ncbi:MAG: hypothetical protein LBS91_02925 [Clostridiales Family XIII bacterium]|jgi:hypothetical protein|nr:hypothetical protein [Clostridiales Family XIII bacterium]
MNIITGKKGATHVSSQQDADANMAFYGAGDYVLPIGGKFGYQVVSNNLITLSDGMVMVQGRKGETDYGQTESVIIENGGQGQTRHDLIVARYARDATTQTESMGIAVVKGTNGEGDPEINTGDIRQGATIHDMPLYRVNIYDLSIFDLKPLFAVWDPHSGVFPYKYNDTLAASAWSGNTYTLANEHFKPIAGIANKSILRKTDVSILPAAAATDAQVLAWAKADISTDTITTDGACKITAAGTKPTINIPVTVVAARSDGVYDLIGVFD